jgi:hypothetical protein
LHFPTAGRRRQRTDRSQSQKTEYLKGWLNILKTEHGGSQAPPPIVMFGETSVSNSNMPTPCAERANPTHIAMEVGRSRSDSISTAQRTQDLFKWHHNLPQSRSEGRC